MRWNPEPGLIALAIFCLVTPALPGQVITPMTQSRLVDSTGRLVSEVIGITGTNEVTAVVRVNNNRRILLRVDRFRFLPLSNSGTGQHIYFESVDCTGQPWIVKVNSSFGTVYRLQGPNQTLYLGDPATLQMITARSERTADLACDTVGPFEIQVVAADPVTDLLVEFTPPFVVFAPRQ